ncbi:hypothetical protein T05_9343 [Trichinella murrelli]|uniref:Uncharacterized protein n=1 Tax=Trichinella murrelli TaxID=144512 RepID=A0A0V0TJM3_9BILA|nr:hypothetical protein T05_9343 [Trichinella murrelli]
MNTIDNMKTIVFLDLPYAGTSGTCGYCGIYSNTVLAMDGCASTSGQRAGTKLHGKLRTSLITMICNIEI